MGENHDETLGVSPGASAAEIRGAFRRLALELHPDRHMYSPIRHLLEENFKRVTIAYEVLSQPEKRRQYDSQYGYQDGQAPAGRQQAACHRHPDRRMVAVCSACGRGLCEPCGTLFPVFIGTGALLGLADCPRQY